MPRLAERLQRLDNPGARAWDIHREAVQRRARGEDVIVLSIGEHDEPTAAPIVAAAERSLQAGRHHYSPAAGEPELRSALSAFRRDLLGDPRGPGQIVVTPGAQTALFATAQCLLGPGDEVIAPEPMYVTYESTLALTGARLVSVSLRPERGFQLDPADVAAAITPRTRVLLLNVPHNPTGMLLDRPTLEALAALCRRHDLWLVNDEVYATLDYHGAFVAPFSVPRLSERCITLFSLSKAYAMAGWRLGAVIGPEPFIGAARELLSYMLFGVTQFVQDAAAFALNEARAEAERLRALYRQRCATVCEALAAVPGLRVVRPQAGMFVLIDIRPLALEAEDFCWGLLEAQRVALLPAAAFGPSGAGHVRLGLGADSALLAEACRRIGAFTAGLQRQNSGAVP